MTHTLKAALRLPSQTLEHPLVLLRSPDQHLGPLQEDSIGHSWQSQGPLGMGLDSHGRVWDPKGGTPTPPKQRLGMHCHRLGPARQGWGVPGLHSDPVKQGLGSPRMEWNPQDRV